MPEMLARSSVNEESVRAWADDVIAGMKQRGSALVAIGREEQVKNVPPERLVVSLTGAAEQIISKGRLQRVCAEGGATATALMRRMGWSRFVVSHLWADGVVSLRPDGTRDLEFVVKVGSYDWPEAIWEKIAA
jgi:uncharacterized protein YgbK (DUF1537 family)